MVKALWKSEGSKDKVVLLISLSGKIHRDSLPALIDDSYTIYEISPLNREAGRDVINNKKSI